MADISVIKLPNASSYNVKDTQALGSAQFSGHELTFNKRGTGQQVLDLGDFDNLNVTDANVGNLIVTGGARFMNGAEGLTYPDLKPLEQKVYESTSQYATAANNAKAAFFFMSVKPYEWNKPWTVRFKVRSHCPSYANYDSVTYATWSGSENNIAYANWNQRAYYIGHYYLAYYPLTQAGFNAGYGHAIAINLLYATGYTSSAYYRTFEVEYYECENCTVTILDSPILWENWTGGNTTNYGGIVNTNAVDRGLQETGDANSTSISTLYNQYGHWIASTAIKRYEMLFSVDDRHLVALNELDNQYTNTAKELSTTTKFDPLGKIYYYNSSGLYNADATIDPGRLYYSVLTDMRYTFNISSNNATNTYTCVAATPCYLKVSIGTDGMATIADAYQPLTSTLPSSPDGYYYIYLGRGHDWYRIMLATEHPVYCYTAHGLERYLGKTVKTDTVDGTTFTGNAATATTASKVSGVAGAANAARHVWFSDSATETSRNYDDDFKYNPSTNTLTVGSITGSAVSATNAANDESGNNIKSNYAASISISGNTITLKNKNNESLGTVTVPDNNTDTWRAIQVNGTQILAGNVSTALNLKAGTNVSLSNSSGTVTIAATDTKYSAGVGLDLSSTTFKAKLKSETNSNQESATVGTTANRQYAVHPDKSGYLSVNVPWTDTTKATAFNSVREIKLTGDVTGSASADGSSGWSIATKTDRISTVGDNRNVATTPNDYSNKLIFQGLKAKATIGNPSSDNYSYVIGLRGYGDNSGGKAHEIAFNNSGINRRTGSTTTWDSWVKLIDSGNYTDYTVKKDGTGASGTWGISISGNAATATSATTATSANKLNTNAGSYLSPVYFSSGIPVATQGNAIPYIVGTSTTAGTWLGTLDGFDDYYDGLMICYKPNVAGASTTTLNLNNKGAKTIYVWNTSKLTTHFPANQPIFLVYTSTLNSGCWVVTNDYWANSDHYTTAWSNTAAGTAAKTATCTNYVLLAKSYINVLIVNANTSETALTLNINNTGAKAIYINGSASSTSNHTLPAGSYLVYYDGTNYYFRTDGKITCDITGNAHTATNLTGFTNTTNSATAIDSAVTNGIYYVNGTSGIYNQSDGSAIVQAYSSSWVSQIYQDYRTGQIALRGKNNGTWQSWRKVLDTGNWSTTITHSSLGLGTIATYNAATAGTKDTWGLVPVIGASDGVMEVGKYIDFHTTDGNTADYDARITAATTGLTLSGTTVGTFSGNLSGTNISASGYVTVNSGSSGTAGGLALYSTNPTAYGIAMRSISNGGAHGYVSGDWATYFYMSGTSAANSLTRGWIFKNVTNGNIASISGAGNAVFNGSVTIGGSINNSAGCRMEYDATNECVQWIFN